MSLRRPSTAALTPWLVGLGIAVLHAAIACLRYANFETSSWDLGIFTQVVNNYAHLRAPTANIHGPGFNVLGDHFSPALAALAPLFWIWPSAQALLVAQASAFGLSAVPITRLARARLGAPAGTVLGVAYGLSAGLLQATVVDFHEVALAVPLLAFGLVALVERRWLAVVWFSLPLLLVKEDLGFTIAAIGLLLIVRGARGTGALLVAAGVLGSLVAVFAIIPMLAHGHRYAYFSQYDDAHHRDTVSAVWGALAPSRWTAGYSTKLHTIATLGWATAFAGWGSSLALLALPTLAWRFVSAQPLYWGTLWHYDAVLMPIMFVAAIETCERLTHSDGLRHWLGTTAPAAALAVSITFASAGAVGSLFDDATWATSPIQRAEAAALSRIPRHVVVLTDLGLISHLAGRDDVYWIGNSGVVVPDYIATLDGAGWTPPPPEAAVRYWNDQYSGHSYRLLSNAHGVTVLQRIR